MRINVNSAAVQFQFTHPGRGATAPHKGVDGRMVVSIHAPREGCDWDVTVSNPKPKSFNSRTPGGVRPRPLILLSDLRHVSIHAPREGCD